VTLYAISAAFAATSTSLLCILILHNKGSDVVGSHSKLQNSFGLDHVDAVNMGVDAAARKLHAERRVLAVDFPEQSSMKVSWAVEQPAAQKRSKSRNSNFDSPEELDFAIIGWPNVSSSYLHLHLG
jgi:hypothetical protein